MDILLKAVQALLNMGAVALLPIMICILGLVFRMKFGASLKAGLMVGIGFQGLSLTVGLLTATIEPITQYYQKMGSGFTAADIGFAAVGGASWTVPFAPIAVPLIVIANFILLRAGLTKVLNVDIWNYIHFLIPGALAYALWGNAVLGLAITVGLSIAALYAGQAIAHKWQDFFGLDGTTCSTLSFTTSVMMTTIAENEAAIGYISLGSLNDTVKALKIDGAEPSTENVKNKTYKIVRPFNIVTNEKKLSNQAKDFMKFIMSKEGQEVVADNGYITVDDKASAYKAAGAKGKIVVAGSSSVTPVMEKLKEAYTALNKDVKIEVQQSDSTTGVTSTVDGVCDIGMASRELADSEVKKGVKPTVIAQDGIAVIVNKKNEVSELESDQIKGIFTGEVISWGDVK